MERELYERTQQGRVKMIDREQRKRFLSQLLFADDTALVTESAEQLQSLLREFGKAYGRNKLRVNVEKNQNYSLTD